jgi:hypothetical protein
VDKILIIVLLLHNRANATSSRIDLNSDRKKNPANHQKIVVVTWQQQRYLSSKD